MKWTEILSGLVNGAFQRFMVALGEKADVAVSRINNEPVFAERLAWYAINGAVELSASQEKAREIMGKNFFGIEEAIKHYGVNPTKRQLACLAQIPWSEEELTLRKNTHVLVAVFPLSILDIREIVKKIPNRTLFYNQDWYDKEAFAKDKGEIGWQLVRKTPVPDSTKKTWGEQQALLTEEDEAPRAQVMVYTIIGHFLATGERLFEKVYVRCIDLDSGGHHVHVGTLDDEGFLVHIWSDDPHRVHVGLASARK